MPTGTDDTTTALGLDWVGLGLTGLDWIGLGWTGLDWVGLQYLEGVRWVEVEVKQHILVEDAHT